MSIRKRLAGIAALGCVFTVVGCQIENCERGAVCEQSDDYHDDDRDGDVRETCIGYCGRLSVCGAPQADDFDRCVEACEERFDALPERTRELCDCAEWSHCSDVIDGRCSPSPGAEPAPAGGACGSASCGAGGAPSAGAPGTGGTGSGVGGISGGSAGSSAGSAPVGGSSGAACTAACDCPAAHACVDGACTPL